MTAEDEILKEFLTESRENLDLLDREFVALESDPSAQHRIASIFRAVHTIKGTAGFLGFNRLVALTHAAENLLSLLRDGKLGLSAEMITTLLSVLDAVRLILASIENDGTEPADDWTALIEALHAHQEAPAKALVAPPRPAPTPKLAVASKVPKAPVVEPPPVAPPVAPPVPETPPAPETPAPEVHAPETYRDTGDGREGPGSETSIRVDVGLLDKLMNLVGELVLARNQILQLGAHRDAAFAGTSQRLNLITTELQEGVMKTRMQPIGNVWNKFPRVVRDLAHECGKRVRIEMEGAETELDRTIIEAIKDPLTHVVRNAVDHGIESPEVRAARGKSATGRLTLRAFHEGGRVNIEISDDGAGIDPERVRQSAVRKGLVSVERAARMTEREAVGLVFMPGFSTADQVTRISGRGVGMDVVKTNVEKIGGSVEIHSAPGCGTALKIRIPLTLAIVPALIVTDDGERYAIPQVSLLELVRLEGAATRTVIETIQGAPVYRLRGNLLPLVYLREALGGARPTHEAHEDTVVNIVVLQADDRQFGLVVDGVNDTEEIVVKPLGKEIKGVSVFAGATIMGDGRVALILDVLGLAQRGGVVTGVRDRAHNETATQTLSEGENRQALLLFQVDDTSRLALPLSMVARLEEFPRDRVERAGRRDVVQYRGEILPLIDLCAVLGGDARDDAAGPLQVVVYAEQGRSVGLVVRRILDIVEEAPALKHRATAHGLLGSTTIQGRVTDLLDVHGVIRAVDPTFFDQQDAA